MLKVRLAEVSDAESIMAIYLANRQGSSRDQDLQRWQKLLSREKTHCLVAEENKVLGYMMYRKETDKSAHVSSLFVGRFAQGIGVGRSLIDHLKSMFEELTLEVYAYNKQAIQFYERNGFQDVSQKSGPKLKLIMKFTKS